MIKKIGIVLALLTASSTLAQNGSVSPYSYFGIGESRALGTYENQMMGGIAMYADSIHVNLKNPAALSKLGVQVGDDFGMTTYAAGISHKQVLLKDYTSTESNRVTNLEYLSIAFALKKGLGFGFGIMPYSSVGYNLESTVANAAGTSIYNSYSGNGGINKVYMSAGWEFAKDLSVGVTGNFNFGSLNYKRIQEAEDVQYGTSDERTSRISGVDFNLALNYSPEINEKNYIVASARVNTQANLKSINTQQLGSFLELPSTEIESYSVDLAATSLSSTELKIPPTYTLGIGYGEKQKWFLGAEYSLQDMSTFKNEFLGVDNLVYSEASSMSIGGFYLPSASSFSSLFQRITYRAGLRMDKSGMIVNDTEINNFGITFGFGIPLGKSFSNINLGFELGRRGTTSADLVEETYAKINVGLSLNDLWFRKRKID